MGYRRTEVAPRCGGRLGSELRQRARWSQVPQTGASPALLSSLLLTGLDHLEQDALPPGTEPVLKVEQPTDDDDVQRQYRQEPSRQIANQLLNQRETPPWTTS